MTVKRVEVLAYAKINLMLDIIRRRTDGYHDLFMIMQSVGVADRVTVEREPGRKLRLTASIDGYWFIYGPAVRHGRADRCGCALLHCRRHLPCTGDWRGAQSLKAYAVLSYCTGKAGLWREYQQGLRLV